jgi:hypothetical protein
MIYPSGQVIKIIQNGCRNVKKILNSPMDSTAHFNIQAVEKLWIRGY